MEVYRNSRTAVRSSSRKLRSCCASGLLARPCRGGCCELSAGEKAMAHVCCQPWLSGGRHVQHQLCRLGVQQLCLPPARACPGLLDSGQAEAEGHHSAFPSLAHAAQPCEQPLACETDTSVLSSSRPRLAAQEHTLGCWMMARLKAITALSRACRMLPRRMSSRLCAPTSRANCSR